MQTIEAMSWNIILINAMEYSTEIFSLSSWLIKYWTTNYLWYFFHFTSSENFCLFFSSIFQLKNMETYVSLEIDKQSHFAMSTT